MTSILTDDDYDLDPVDADAFERAIAMTRANGGPDAVQIESMLRKRPWEEVGRFAAMCRQADNLALGLHLTPPCWATEADLVPDPNEPDDAYGRRAAAVLRKRLLAAGLSAYEPDPLDALERVKRAREIDVSEQPSPKL
jgi:hypothetical protein